MKNMFFFMGVLKNLRNFEKPAPPTDSWKLIRVGFTLKLKEGRSHLLASLNALVCFQFPGWPCEVKIKIVSLFDILEGEVEDRTVLVSFFTCVWFEPHWINCVVLPLCLKWQLSSNCKTTKTFMKKKENNFVSVFLSQSMNLLLSTL